MGARRGKSGRVMLRWAFGYLAMAIVVAIGFGALQGTRAPEPRVATAASEHSSARARSERVDARDLEDEESWEDEGAWEDDGYAEDDSYAEDDGYYAEDDGYAEDESDPDEGADPRDESGRATGGGLEYVVRAGPGGHFLIEAQVNGMPMTFLVDTGASDIVLTVEDARRVGLEPRTLEYTQRYATANGEVRGAPVVLRELRIGQFRLFDVAASVNEAPLGISLLGMDFLEQLNGYEVQRGRLILRW